MTETLAFNDRGAVISDCQRYRYVLWRLWSRSKPLALFIMLNPSTADATEDDPTIRRCIGFARAWGLGGIRVVNVYPFRATRPADLWKADNPLGTENLLTIRNRIDRKGVAIAAWGAHARPEDVKPIRNLFYEEGVPLYALKMTKDGAPGHPLYIAADTVPIAYEPAGNKVAVGDQWPGLSTGGN